MAREPSKILTLADVTDIAKQVEVQAKVVEREEKKLEKLNTQLAKAKGLAFAALTEEQKNTWKT